MQCAAQTVSWHIKDAGDSFRHHLPQEQLLDIIDDTCHLDPLLLQQAELMDTEMFSLLCLSEPMSEPQQQMCVALCALMTLRQTRHGVSASYPDVHMMSQKA